ncbi:Xaa-Pro peptidase family protein [Bradyrhizobium arachidis]|uniref:M24 family metallopeptidase n=1 Tax=Bradyrhizobium arachidis TaxID=858423 RepID=UPI002161BB3E|nr:Xaa-Pro peptidase family protein [Bradyrhizobium arachidis]UVO35704.1 Xaa-Pro peptidase family protein [Bradyrhizobium arachidis]
MNESILEAKSVAYPEPNMSALRALAVELGVDAVVAITPENVVYASNVFLMSPGLRTRQPFVILPAAREPIALVATTEYRQMLDESWIKDVRSYVEFAKDPADALAEVLIEVGLDRGSIGIEFDYLSAKSHGQLSRKMPEAKFIDTGKSIASIRAVKSEDEVRLLEKIAKQTHRAVLDAMSASRLGETERVMANRIVDGIVNGGADGMRFVIFASGPRTRYNHASPTDRVPLKSEIIRFDVGGKYGAWGSDFARTYSTGEPTSLQRDTYRKLWDIHTATINTVRPGMAAEEPYFFCKKQFENAGLELTMSHIGHSFGIEAHESPMIRPGEKTKLKAGMVINIEPGVTDAAGTVYHLEDLFVVTDQGPRLLTLGFAPREIPIIGEPIRV